MPERLAGSGANDLREMRKRQAADLRRIIGHDGLSLKTDTAVELERDGRFDGEYGRLAERLYSGFMAMAATTGDARLVELSERPNILNGTYVLTSILGYGPEAYIAYLRGTERVGSVDDLADIMRRSHDVPKFFADTHIKANHTAELNFGLLQYPPLYETLPFVTDDGQDGAAVFRPAELTLRETRLEIARRQLEGEIPPEDGSVPHCPAIGRVMTAIWNAGIEECATDPKLYRAALGSL